MKQVSAGDWRSILLGIWLFSLLIGSFATFYVLMNTDVVSCIIAKPDTSVAKEKGESTNNNNSVNQCRRVELLNSNLNISFNSYMFLIVLFAGLLGGTLRVISSFWYHLGVEDFSYNWLAYYIALPFTGAGLSLVIYFVIRGGFFSGTQAGSSELNPFAFAALGTLTGLYSDNTLAKLKKLAETLLEESPKKDFEKVLKVSALNLSAQSINDKKPTTLTAKISGGKSPYTYEISFDNSSFQTISQKTKTGNIKAKITKPAAIAEKTEVKYKIKVTDSANQEIELDGDKLIKVEFD